MSSRRIHLERLLSRKVHDPAGKLAGRIEEFRCRKDGREVVIVEYLLGRGGLMQRLSIARLWGRGNRASRKVPWDKMDLSDPQHPRITCPAEELDTIDQQ